MLNAKDIVRKVRALKASRATEAEAAKAHAAVTCVEAKLGFEVAPPTPGLPTSSCIAASMAPRGRSRRTSTSVVDKGRKP